MAEAREARVKVLLDVNNALTNVERLRKAINTISINDIKSKDTDKIFNGLINNASKAEQSIKTLSKNYQQAVKEMQDALSKNNVSFTFQRSDEYTKLRNNVSNTRQALENFKTALEQIKTTQKGLISTETLERLNTLNKRLSKANDKTAKLAEKFKTFDSTNFNSSITNLVNAINNLNSNGLSNSVNAMNRLGKSINNNTNVKSNNSNNIASVGNSNMPPSQLSRNKTGWLTTYWASEQDDLFKYFFVRLKSGIAKSLGTYVENYITNAIPNTFNALVNYEQNRVNFAQVMPEDVGNNQKLMNNAMREFMNIASDYGTSVQEVTEAGRLWGRQYKDVAMVQELVRNSTKLSITDNMSLTEVNKALEATMQQYNVKLKDANEAQQVSGRIVDVWAKLADNAVVTAQDLARASEQAGGSAYQAGVSFDYLQAMIATMSTTTGKSGAEVGRAIRSMLVSMNSAKAQKFFTQLGIATKELGKDGVLRVRSFEKVITDLMKKLKTYPKDASSAILAMSGGRLILALSYGNI